MDIEILKAEFEASECFKRFERVVQYVTFDFGTYCAKVDIPIDAEKFVSGLIFSWKAWREAKAQAVPDGFVLVPTTPSCEMWSGIARDLGRYMQMHNRYCPKSLKKYFDRFIGEIPEWLNKEVKDWDSDHAFATADLPAFIYMSMLEAARGGNE